MKRFRYRAANASLRCSIRLPDTKRSNSSTSYLKTTENKLTFVYVTDVSFFVLCYEERDAWLSVITAIAPGLVMFLTIMHILKTSAHGSLFVLSFCMFFR
jgi:hypothetical protein